MPLSLHAAFVPTALQVVQAINKLIDKAETWCGETGCPEGDLFATRRLCAAGAVDCLQVDATRCGGYTGWLRAAAVAAAHGLQVSAHCAPNLHAPVGAAASNARHLEWFHDHARIEAAVLEGALDPTGGWVEPDRSAPGHGFVFLPERADELAGRGHR